MTEIPAWTQNYQPGVGAEIEEPQESLAWLALNAAAEAKSLVATDFFGRTMTYEQLGDRITRVAEGLRRLGVRRGDRVAIVLPNCPQHIIAFYAVLRLGAVVVEHNPLYTARELRHMFEDHSARVAICWDVAVEKLQQLPMDIPLNTIVSVNMTKAFPRVKQWALKLPVPAVREMRDRLTSSVRGTVTWEKLVAADPLPEHYRGPDVDDLAAIQYTSGTTSQPKGVLLSHKNLYSNALQAQQWLHGIGKGEQEVTYGVLPLFHAFGLTLVGTLGVLVHARLVLFPTFDVTMTLDAMKRIPATVFGAVPPIFAAVAAMAKKRHIPITSCKFNISGAMSLPVETALLWEELSGWPLIEGYGMTEAAPVIAGNPSYEGRKIGTVGLPFPSTRVRVVAVDDVEKEVEQGQPGELLAAGPQVFEGYWNNPSETQHTLLEGGWLRTGDIVVQDEQGFLTIVDRVKDMIITGGFNVSPTEVESVLRAHPAIEDITVVGMDNPLGAETVVAAIVLQDGYAFDEDDLRSFGRQRLAAYKVPRKFYRVSELPKSMLGKALRKEVRAQLEQLDKTEAEKRAA